MKVRPAAIFSFCALIFFIVFVYQAREWRLQARLYPWAIGIPMLVLAAVQVVLDLKGIEGKKSPDATPVDFQFNKDVEPTLARRRAINIFSWIFGFLLGVWLLGFNITVPLLVFGYLRIQSGESWGLSLILTAAAWLVFYMLFIKLLTLPFPEGLVFTWLGIA
ncbi:MAG TPA: tripartite tricarboxylate transporter TctB family protein [Terriglobales bacterium]|nr:tripartite tricarboxylate transporter TctB family protein [Terriglobales bacterium]